MLPYCGSGGETLKVGNKLELIRKHSYFKKDLVGPPLHLYLFLTCHVEMFIEMSFKIIKISFLSQPEEKAEPEMVLAGTKGKIWLLIAVNGNNSLNRDILTVRCSNFKNQDSFGLLIGIKMT